MNYQHRTREKFKLIVQVCHTNGFLTNVKMCTILWFIQSWLEIFRSPVQVDGIAIRTQYAHFKIVLITVSIMIFFSIHIWVYLISTMKEKS